MASDDLDGLAGGSRPIRVPVRGRWRMMDRIGQFLRRQRLHLWPWDGRPVPATTWCCARAGRRTRCPASRAGPSRAGSRPPAGRRRSWRGARAAVLRGADVVHPGGDGRAQHPQRLVAIPRRPEDPSPESCIAPCPARRTRRGPSATDPPGFPLPGHAASCRCARKRARARACFGSHHGWTNKPKPRSRRIDSRTQKVVLVVNTSAAASTPVYFAMTGAAAESDTASR
jgi:hypothetical protein